MAQKNDHFVILKIYKLQHSSSPVIGILELHKLNHTYLICNSSSISKNYLIRIVNVYEIKC